MEDSNNKRFNKRHYYTMKEKLEIINYYHAVDEKGNKIHTKSEVKFNSKSNPNSNNKTTKNSRKY